MNNIIKSNFVKFIIAILCVTMIVCSLATISNASNFDTEAFDKDVEETGVQKAVTNTAETVVAVMRVVSVAIAIIVLLVIAMKYMIAAPGEKADIKKQAVAYVVGAFILFSATQIIALLISISKNFTKSGTK